MHASTDESIGNFAFLACFRLASVSISSSVKEIGDSAFRGCHDFLRCDKLCGSGQTSCNARCGSLGCTVLAMSELRCPGNEQCSLCPEGREEDNGDGDSTEEEDESVDNSGQPALSIITGMMLSTIINIFVYPL